MDSDQPFWKRVSVQVVAGVLTLGIISAITWAYTPTRDAAIEAASKAWALAFYRVAIWQVAATALALFVVYLLLRYWPAKPPSRLQLQILGAFARHDEVWLDLAEIVDSVGVSKVAVRAAIDDMPHIAVKKIGGYGQLRIGLTSLGTSIVASAFPHGINGAAQSDDSHDEPPY